MTRLHPDRAEAPKRGTHSRSRAPLVVLLALAAWLSAAAVLASEVVVLVRDRDGRALPDVALRLESAHAANPLSGIRRGVSDAEGRAFFSGLGEGVWRITAVVPRGYVETKMNPLVDAPQVTLRGEPGERFEVLLELWRGAPLVLELSVRGGGRSASAVAGVEALSGGQPRTLLLEDGVARELLLPEGRYEVRLLGPSGLRLEAVIHDGPRLAGGGVLVELEESFTATHVEWILAADALIEGSLVQEGPEPLGRPVAELIEAGSWASRPEAELGWRPTRASARFLDGPERRQAYEIRVPSGRWRVRVAGEGVVTDPPHVDVDLREGEVARADFRVSGQRDEPCTLGAWLEGLGTGLGGARPPALVGLWAGDADPLLDDPLRIERARRGGSVRFDAVEPGASYRLVARADGFLDTEKRVALVCEEEAWHSLSIELEEGASLAFEALGEEGQPVSGVTLRASALEESARARFPDTPAPTAWEARSDHSGRGRLGGLLPGTYRVEARVEGRRAGELFARLAESDARDGALDVQLGAEERRALALRVMPGAQAEATVFCDDGGLLSGGLEARALDAARFRASFERAAREGNRVGIEELVESEAALALSSLALEGRQRETLRLGPLEEGAFVLALRPEGFSHWSFVGELDEPESALVFEARAGEPESLGNVALPCAPRARVGLGLEEPALLTRRLAALSASWLELGEDESVALEARLEGGRILLRGMPVGEGRVELSLRHPHLLPGGLVSFDFDARFERGLVVERVVEGLSLGGALEVRVAEGRQAPPAFRLLGAEGRSVTATPDDEGRARFEALAPGFWMLEPCAEPACGEKSAGEGREFEVLGGETLFVDWERS